VKVYNPKNCSLLTCGYASAASGPIQPEGQYCKSDMSSQPISDISETFYLYIETLMVSMFTSE
jgi:hypothetical protein